MYWILIKSTKNERPRFLMIQQWFWMGVKSRWSFPIYYFRLKKNNNSKFFGTKRFIKTEPISKALSTKHDVTGNFWRRRKIKPAQIYIICRSISKEVKGLISPAFGLCGTYRFNKNPPYITVDNPEVLMVVTGFQYPLPNPRTEYTRTKAPAN